jgi:pyruvate,water dikinase
LAVLYEASANPELDPSMASSYNTRNYFMVARSFVSLQSRFGFHFSSVEALVSDRRSENYASFRFKGGAADAGRRTARVRLIGQLLEEQDFRIRLREDCLEARLDGRPAAEMEKRLMALGYLIIHTRQLDMIMNNPNEAAAQRTRIRSDLDQLFQS